LDLLLVTVTDSTSYSGFTGFTPSEDLLAVLNLGLVTAGGVVSKVNGRDVTTTLISGTVAPSRVRHMQKEKTKGLWRKCDEKEGDRGRGLRGLYRFVAMQMQTNVGLPANVIDTNYSRGRTQPATVLSHHCRLRET
jgi:hypothetical protein